MKFNQTMKPPVLKYLSFTLIFSLLSVASFAQSNPVFQEFTILKDTPFEMTLESNPSAIVIDHLDHGWANFDLNFESSGIYSLSYTPPAGFTGEDELIIEYKGESPFPGFWPPRYTKIKFKVVESIIYTSSDYANMQVNGGTLVLDPLANDSGTHEPLNIISLPLVTNGEAITYPDNTLAFTVKPDFEGMAYIKYVVEDSLGTKETGNISICVIDNSNIAGHDTIRIATTNTNPATIMLPLTGFYVDPNNEPNMGSVSFIGSDVLEYTPDFLSDGEDTFVLLKANGSYSRTVIVDVIFIPEPNNLVVDDYIYTAKNTSISFNVQENDIQDNFDIADWTMASELEYLGDGDFIYTPAQDFTGPQQFSYTVANTFYTEVGYIYVNVDNFDPEDVDTYLLQTPKNTPLVINYDIPLSNFDFNVIEAGSLGNLISHDGHDTISVGCDEINGYNLAVYYPDSNNVGIDNLTLEYCPPGDSCVSIAIEVEILDLGLDSICFCVDDCVWAGDTDNDGRVTVKDLLPIGYYIGETGPEREHAYMPEWFGQECDDWGDYQAQNLENLKHIDTDGDGIVTASDSNAIVGFYDRFHTLVTPIDLVPTEFPFAFIPHQDSVEIGDWLFIDVAIGNAQYPTIDIHGLAFALNLPPEAIDSTSLFIDYHDDCWFTNNSSTLEIAQQPVAGRLETAYTRTTGFNVSGAGIIATFGFIVTDELDGFRSDGIYPLHMSLTEGIGMNGEGQNVAIPGATSTVFVNLNKTKKSLSDDDVNVFPNPTNGQFSMYLNGDHEITSYEVYSLMGTKITEQQVEKSNEVHADLSAVQSGMYLIKINTTDRPIVKKVEVIN